MPISVIRDCTLRGSLTVTALSRSLHVTHWRTLSRGQHEHITAS
jgi:hypothetical protein